MHEGPESGHLTQDLLVGTEALPSDGMGLDFLLTCCLTALKTCLYHTPHGLTGDSEQGRADIYSHQSSGIFMISKRRVRASKQMGKRGRIASLNKTTAYPVKSAFQMA